MFSKHNTEWKGVEEADRSGSEACSHTGYNFHTKWSNDWFRLQRLHATPVLSGLWIRWTPALSPNCTGCHGGKGADSGSPAQWRESSQRSRWTHLAAFRKQPTASNMTPGLGSPGWGRQWSPWKPSEDCHWVHANLWDTSWKERVTAKLRSSPPSLTRCFSYECCITNHHMLGALTKEHGVMLRDSDRGKQGRLVWAPWWAQPQRLEVTRWVGKLPQLERPCVGGSGRTARAAWASAEQEMGYDRITGHSTDQEWSQPPTTQSLSEWSQAPCASAPLRLEAQLPPALEMKAHHTESQGDRYSLNGMGPCVHANIHKDHFVAFFFLNKAYSTSTSGNIFQTLPFAFRLKYHCISGYNDYLSLVSNLFTEGPAQ